MSKFMVGQKVRAIHWQNSFGIIESINQKIGDTILNGWEQHNVKMENGGVLSCSEESLTGEVLLSNSQIIDGITNILQDDIPQCEIIKDIHDFITKEFYERRSEELNKGGRK